MNQTPRPTPRLALGRLSCRPGRVLAAGASALALGGLLASAAPAAAKPAGTTPAASAAPATAGLRAACAAVPPGHMRCFVLYRPQQVKRALALGQATHPVGWGARALERAYRLPANLAARQTIAVSIAFHTPHLADYLKTYRAHYGLPPCSTASGCLRIVNQNGKASPVAPSGLNTGWDLEATLDVSMISAACPHCKILVVEASGNDDASLARTDDTAARLGAGVISNSYGQRENGQALAYRKDYVHPGRMVVVSSGDYGFDAANFPADLAAVTAVGGTSLAIAHNRRGFSEQVWNDPSLFGASGSGCSAYVSKPSWQHDRHCPGRTVADISAVAANVPIFNAAYGGWVTVAGTSVSSPFVAGAYGLAGNAASVTPRHLYQHAADFFDITRGNNALVGGTPEQVCGDDYLCAAKQGYDAPTGLGSPNGIAGL
jgi:Subtilase family